MRNYLPCGGLFGGIWNEELVMRNYLPCGGHFGGIWNEELGMRNEELFAMRRTFWGNEE